MNSTLDAHDSGNAGNTADGICDDGAGHCTLRAAIDEANLAPLGSTIGITVPAGTYALDAGLGTIFISGGANITITGAGSSTTTVDGVNLSTVQLFMTDVAVTVSMSGLTITRGSGIDGGAIQNSGTLTLTNSIVSNSTAGNVGGGIYNDGTLTLTGATVSGNQANASGLADVNFFCDAGGGICNDGGTVTLNSGTRITSNVAASNGGGVDNKGTLTGAGTLFSGNTANTSNSSGGAIDTQTATVSVSDSMFVNNAAHTAGAMSLFGSGTLTVSGSTFSGNSAGNGGGGIAINGGTATITNSTFSGNTTPGLANGGAVSNAGGAMTLNGVTISGNDNGITNFSGTISVQNSIISNSSVGSNCSGTITDGGYNIDLGPSCGFMATSSTSHSMSNTNPMLGALASNGGPTQTMALQSGSPAIDAIPVSAGICSNSAPSTDQRGVARPQGSGCDIGAYELQPTPTASPTVTVTATATVTAAATPTATPTASAPTPTPTAAPAPSGGGGTTSSSSTTSSTSPSTSTSSGDAQVVGSQSAGTGVLNVAAPNTPLTTGILAPDAAPLVDPGLITGTAPAPITAQVSTTTTNTVAVVAGNFVLVVPPGSIQAPSGSAVIDIKPATNVPIPGGPAQFSPFGSGPTSRSRTRARASQSRSSRWPYRSRSSTTPPMWPRLRATQPP